MANFFYAGTTSQTIDLFIQDSSSTTGAGLAALAYNTASLTAYYRKGATGTATAITLATQTVGGAWSSGGFVEVDATNMKGVYRLDIPNALIDTAGITHVVLRGAANMAPVTVRIDCRAAPSDAKKINAVSTSGVTTIKPVLGLAVDGVITTLTNLPAAPTDWLAAAAVKADAVTKIQAGLATPTNITSATGIVLAAATHTGAVIPTVTTLTGHTAQTGDSFALANGAAGFVAIDTVVDAIKVKTDYLPSATAGAAGGVFIAGTNAATTVTTSFTTTFTGNLTGSVGSVTGAVGSVAGNVDGNVSGTVILADTSSDAIIADAVWNAATVTYGGVGSYGEHVESLLAGGDATEAKQDQLIAAVITNAAGVDIAADIIAVKAETALIVADTNELQTDDVPGLIATLDAVVDTVKVDTAAIKVFTDASTAQTGDTFGSLPTNFASLVITAGGAVDALTQGYLNTLISETSAGRIAGNVSTFLDNADAATAQTVDDVGGGGSAPTAAAVADAVWDEASADHVAAGSMGVLQGSTGTGANTVNVTLSDDSANLVAGSEINVQTTAGVMLGVYGTTNTSGVVTFYLDDGSYKMVVTDRSGYATHTAESVTVDETPEAVALTVTASAGSDAGWLG